jgi:hypothetical protein
LTENRIDSPIYECELPEWKLRYRLALLEKDPTRLPQRIFDARIAIFHSLARLQPRDPVEQRTAMMDALEDLANLRAA